MHMEISATYEGQRVHVGSRRMMDAKKLLVDEINEQIEGINFK